MGLALLLDYHGLFRTVYFLKLLVYNYALQYGVCVHVLIQILFFMRKSIV